MTFIIRTPKQNVAANNKIETTLVSGWGGYPTVQARVVSPLSLSDFRTQLELRTPFIVRGLGRSYGDSANARFLIQSTYCDHFIDFDPNRGLLTVESGVSLRDILKVVVKWGWFLPVTPGTSFVTVGGAVASDVHGKNHHVAGTFGQYVVSLSLMLGTGDVVTTSPTELPDLFHATCGGMGLTGIILSVTLQLIPIESAYITQKTIKTRSLDEVCDAFEANSEATYSVAWLDCLAKNQHLGRSILMLGEHSNSGGLELSIKEPIRNPIFAPASLLNNVTMRMFNEGYWAKLSHNKIRTAHLLSFFYPLDAVGEWNKLYGREGFVQYQFVVPKANGVSNLRKILDKITQSGLLPFLAVLKKFGPGNNNLLSFPIEGYTLALDLKLTKSTIDLLHKIDSVVEDMGGRVYLTKDATMREATFKLTYPKWQEFDSVRLKYGAVGRFESNQSKRLGLA